MRSSLATSADTVVTSGSRNPRPVTTRSELPPTHGVEAMLWFLTCPVPPLMLRRYVSSVPTLVLRSLLMLFLAIRRRHQGHS